LLQILQDALTTAPSHTEYHKSRAAYPCCGTKARLILNKFSDFGLLVNEYRFVEEIHSETADSQSALNALWFRWTKVALEHVSSECLGPLITIIRPVLRTFLLSVTDTRCFNFSYWQFGRKL